MRKLSAFWAVSENTQKPKSCVVYHHFPIFKWPWPFRHGPDYAPSSAAAKALLAVDKEASSPAGLRFFEICRYRYHHAEEIILYANTCFIMFYQLYSHEIPIIIIISPIYVI